MPELPSEPSVNTIKKQLEENPPTEGDIKKLMEHIEATPSGADEFLKNLESFPSIFPDSITTYFMKKEGLDTNDPRVVRMISIATQKFISDLILDSMMQAKAKGIASVSGMPVTLTEELLSPVMKEKGMDLQKAPYHM